MKNRIKTFVLTGLLVCSLASCGNAQQAENNAQTTAAETLILGQKSEPSEKYTLYLGLNDKDTYEQIISTEEALEKANLICAKYAGGYTQLSARGGWTNDDGTLGHENTIVYLIYDISEENLKAMLDEFLKEFNQSSVLVEKESASHIYYSGN